MRDYFDYDREPDDYYDIDDEVMRNMEEELERMEYERELDPIEEPDYTYDPDEENYADKWERDIDELDPDDWESHMSTAEPDEADFDFDDYVFETDDIQEEDEDPTTWEFI